MHMFLARVDVLLACWYFVQAYHIHIRSTSHHQNTIEAKKRKSGEVVEPRPTGPPPPQPKSDTPIYAIPPGQSPAVTSGPNYCHVCCFGFANSEVFKNTKG